MWQRYDNLAIKTARDNYSSAEQFGPSCYKELKVTEDWDRFAYWHYCGKIVGYDVDNRKRTFDKMPINIYATKTKHLDVEMAWRPTATIIDLPIKYKLLDRPLTRVILGTERTYTDTWKLPYPVVITPRYLKNSEICRDVNWPLIRLHCYHDKLSILQFSSVRLALRSDNHIIHYQILKILIKVIKKLDKIKIKFEKNELIYKKLMKFLEQNEETVDSKLNLEKSGTLDRTPAQLTKKTAAGSVNKAKNAKTKQKPKGKGKVEQIDHSKISLNKQRVDTGGDNVQCLYMKFNFNGINTYWKLFIKNQVLNVVPIFQFEYNENGSENVGEFSSISPSFDSSSSNSHLDELVKEEMIKYFGQLFNFVKDIKLDNVKNQSSSSSLTDNKKIRNYKTINFEPSKPVLVKHKAATTYCLDQNIYIKMSQVLDYFKLPKAKQYDLQGDKKQDGYHVIREEPNRKKFPGKKDKTPRVRFADEVGGQIEETFVDKNEEVIDKNYILCRDKKEYKECIEEQYIFTLFEEDLQDYYNDLVDEEEGKASKHEEEEGEEEEEDEEEGEGEEQPPEDSEEIDEFDLENGQTNGGVVFSFVESQDEVIEEEESSEESSGQLIESDIPIRLVKKFFKRKDDDSFIDSEYNVPSTPTVTSANSADVYKHNDQLINLIMDNKKIISTIIETRKELILQNDKFKEKEVLYERRKGLKENFNKQHNFMQQFYSSKKYPASNLPVIVKIRNQFFKGKLQKDISRFKLNHLPENILKRVFLKPTIRENIIGCRYNEALPYPIIYNFKASVSELFGMDSLSEEESEDDIQEEQIESIVALKEYESTSDSLLTITVEDSAVDSEETFTITTSEMMFGQIERSICEQSEGQIDEMEAGEVENDEELGEYEDDVYEYFSNLPRYQVPTTQIPKKGYYIKKLFKKSFFKFELLNQIMHKKVLINLLKFVFSCKHIGIKRLASIILYHLSVYKKCKYFFLKFGRYGIFNLLKVYQNYGDLKLKISIMGILCDILQYDTSSAILPAIFGKEYFVGKQIEDLQMFFSEEIADSRLKFRNFYDELPKLECQLLGIKIITLMFHVIQTMFTPSRLFSASEFSFEPIIKTARHEEPYILKKLRNLTISFLECVSENFNDYAFQYLFEKDDCLNEMIKLFLNEEESAKVKEKIATLFQNIMHCPRSIVYNYVAYYKMLIVQLKNFEDPGMKCKILEILAIIIDTKFGPEITRDLNVWSHILPFLLDSNEDVKYSALLVANSMARHALIVNTYFTHHIITLLIKILIKANMEIKQLVLIILLRAFNNKPLLKDTFSKSMYSKWISDWILSIPKHEFTIVWPNFMYLVNELAKEPCHLNAIFNKSTFRLILKALDDEVTDETLTMLCLNTINLSLRDSFIKDIFLNIKNSIKIVLKSLWNYNLNSVSLLSTYCTFMILVCKNNQFAVQQIITCNSLSWLLNKRNHPFLGILVNQVINSIIDGFLPLKFACKGILDTTDRINRGFYVTRRMYDDPRDFPIFLENLPLLSNKAVPLVISQNPDLFPIPEEEASEESDERPQISPEEPEPEMYGETDLSDLRRSSTLFLPDREMTEVHDEETAEGDDLSGSTLFTPRQPHKQQILRPTKPNEYQFIKDLLITNGIINDTENKFTEPIYVFRLRIGFMHDDGYHLRRVKGGFIKVPVHYPGPENRTQLLPMIDIIEKYLMKEFGVKYYYKLCKQFNKYKRIRECNLNDDFLVLWLRNFFVYYYGHQCLRRKVMSANQEVTRMSSDQNEDLMQVYRFRELLNDILYKTDTFLYFKDKYEPCKPGSELNYNTLCLNMEKFKAQRTQTEFVETESETDETYDTDFEDRRESPVMFEKESELSIGIESTKNVGTQTQKIFPLVEPSVIEESVDSIDNAIMRSLYVQKMKTDSPTFLHETEDNGGICEDVFDELYNSDDEFEFTMQELGKQDEPVEKEISEELDISDEEKKFEDAEISIVHSIKSEVSAPPQKPRERVEESMRIQSTCSQLLQEQSQIYTNWSDQLRASQMMVEESSQGDEISSKQFNDDEALPEQKAKIIDRLPPLPEEFGEYTPVQSKVSVIPSKEYYIGETKEEEYDPEAEISEMPQILHPDRIYSYLFETKTEEESEEISDKEMSLEKRSDEFEYEIPLVDDSDFTDQSDRAKMNEIYKTLWYGEGVDDAVDIGSQEQLLDDSEEISATLGETDQSPLNELFEISSGPSVDTSTEILQRLPTYKAYISRDRRLCEEFSDVVSSYSELDVCENYIKYHFDQIGINDEEMISALNKVPTYVLTRDVPVVLPRKNIKLMLELLQIRHNKVSLMEDAYNVIKMDSPFSTTVSDDLIEDFDRTIIVSATSVSESICSTGTLKTRPSISWTSQSSNLSTTIYGDSSDEEAELIETIDSLSSWELPELPEILKTLKPEEKLYYRKVGSNIYSFEDKVKRDPHFEDELSIIEFLKGRLAHECVPGDELIIPTGQEQTQETVEPDTVNLVDDSSARRSENVKPSGKDGEAAGVESAAFESSSSPLLGQKSVEHISIEESSCDDISSESESPLLEESSSETSSDSSEYSEDEASVGKPSTVTNLEESSIYEIIEELSDEEFSVEELSIEEESSGEEESSSSEIDTVTLIKADQKYSIECVYDINLQQVFNKIISKIDAITFKYLKPLTLRKLLLKVIGVISSEVCRHFSENVVTPPTEELKLYQLDSFIQNYVNRTGNNIIPIGTLKCGLNYEKAVLFKVLGDQLGVPSRLVQTPNGHAWNEVFLPIRKNMFNLEPNYIINMDSKPVELIKMNTQFSKNFQASRYINKKVELRDNQLHLNYPSTKRFKLLFEKKISMDIEDFENYDELFMYMSTPSYVSEDTMQPSLRRDGDSSTRDVTNFEVIDEEMFGEGFPGDEYNEEEYTGDLLGEEGFLTNEYIGEEEFSEGEEFIDEETFEGMRASRFKEDDKGIRKEKLSIVKRKRSISEITISTVSLSDSDSVETISEEVTSEETNYDTSSTDLSYEEEPVCDDAVDEIKSLGMYESEMSIYESIQDSNVVDFGEIVFPFIKPTDYKQKLSAEFYNKIEYKNVFECDSIAEDKKQHDSDNCSLDGDIQIGEDRPSVHIALKKYNIFDDLNLFKNFIKFNKFINFVNYNYETSDDNEDENLDLLHKLSCHFKEDQQCYSNFKSFGLKWKKLKTLFNSYQNLFMHFEHTLRKRKRAVSEINTEEYVKHKEFWGSFSYDDHFSDGEMIEQIYEMNEYINRKLGEFNDTIFVCENRIPNIYHLKVRKSSRVLKYLPPVLLNALINLEQEQLIEKYLVEFKKKGNKKRRKELQKMFESEIYNKYYNVLINLNNYEEYNLLLTLKDIEEYLDCKSLSVTMEKVSPVIKSKKKSHVFRKPKKSKKRSTSPIKRSGRKRSSLSTSPIRWSMRRSTVSSERSLLDYTDINQESHFKPRLISDRPTMTFNDNLETTKRLPLVKGDGKTFSNVNYVSMKDLKDYQKQIKFQDELYEDSNLETVNYFNIDSESKIKFIETPQLYRSYSYNFREIYSTLQPNPPIIEKDAEKLPSYKITQDENVQYERPTLISTVEPENFDDNLRFGHWLKKFNIAKKDLITQDSEDKFQIKTPKKLNTKNELKNLNSDKYELKRSKKAKENFKNLYKSMLDNSMLLQSDGSAQ